MMQRRLRGFAPVIDAGIDNLVLGSFPSAASLAAGEYYAHPRNQFWQLLGAILGEPLASMRYADRLACVLSHRIGIWDVLAACNRRGSLDASIRQHAANDFARLARLVPRLRRVLFNGASAGRSTRGYETVVLPSSSPAHAARSFEQKLVLWRAAFGPAGAGPRGCT